MVHLRVSSTPMTPQASSVGEIISGALQPHHAPSAVVALGNTGGLASSVGGRVPVAPETLFEIGSITKVFTAALVLQLVAEGALGLEDPVVNHLPSFRLADSDATASVTIRHLLTHTSGIDAADDFTDTGDEDDCLERYVDEVVAGSGLVHPIGVRWSYCNAGYSVLGRVVEVLRHQPWDDVLDARVLKACGVSAATRPRLGPGHAVAPGHRLDLTTGIVHPDSRSLPRSIGPAGGTLLATAEDLVLFTVALLGGELIPLTLVEEMLSPSVHVGLVDQGLAWVLIPGGQRTAVHAGGTLGYTSYLATRPDSRGALSVLANGPGARTVSMAVRRALFGEADDSTPATSVAENNDATEPQQEQIPTGACAGTYRRRGVSIRIDDANPFLTAGITYEPPLNRLFDPVPPVELEPRGGMRFASRVPYGDEDLLWAFSDLDREGRPQGLFSSRMHIREES